MVSAQIPHSKLLFVLLILVLLSAPVAAQNITFADPDSTVHQDVVMYGVNVTSGYFEQLAVYNTTTTGIYLSDSNASDIMFVFKPQYSNPLDDPIPFLTGFIGWVQTNALFLMIIGMVGALLFKRF